MTGGSWLAKLLTGAVEGPTLPPILSVLAFLLGQLPLGLAPTTRKEKAVQGALAVPRSSSWVPGHPWLEGSLQREASVEADMEPRGATWSHGQLRVWEEEERALGVRPALSESRPQSDWNLPLSVKSGIRKWDDFVLCLSALTAFPQPEL